MSEPKKPNDLTDAELIAAGKNIGTTELDHVMYQLASRLEAALERERLDVDVFLRVTRSHRKCCDMILRMAEERLAAREQKGGGE